MNVYDFDNTIYDGESVVDFYFFLMKKDKKLIKMLPKVLTMLVKYKLCLVSVEEMYENCNRYSQKLMAGIADIDAEIKEFWDINEHRIKDFYKKVKNENDLILSASCDFLLAEICRRVGIKKVISSVVDKKTGEVISLCFNSKKAETFEKLYPDVMIDNFYTDSMNDKHMFDLSKNVYLVKGSKIKKIK